MKIEVKHKALIESVIKESDKFKGNEELLEIFCEAIYKKSYLLIDAIRDMSRLRRHLTMICDSCMEQIIKEKNKYNKTKIYRQINSQTKKSEDVIGLRENFATKENIVSLKSTLEDDEMLNRELQRQQMGSSLINLKEEIQRSEKYDSVDSLIDPLDFCPQKRISEPTIDRLVQIVKSIDAQYPKKRYYEIFSLRYIKRYNQMQTAREMKISQVELSKRFVELIRLTKEEI
ncbi:MAG: hypothetical protein IJD57_05125 [Candidatus Gastranaerophilales bacterium]|nr:hypothetical protein [Candidatus Gastranaerophilales bacterium]